MAEFANICSFFSSIAYFCTSFIKGLIILLEYKIETKKL